MALYFTALLCEINSILGSFPNGVSENRETNTSPELSTDLAFSAFAFLFVSYSQFQEFRNSLSVAFPEVDLSCFPPKKIKFFSSHSSPQFIEERLNLLDAWFQKLLSVPDSPLPSSPLLVQFLSSDKSDIKIESVEFKEEEISPDSEVTDIAIISTRSMLDHTLFEILWVRIDDISFELVGCFLLCYVTSVLLQCAC